MSVQQPPVASQHQSPQSEFELRRAALVGEIGGVRPFPLLDFRFVLILLLHYPAFPVFIESRLSPISFHVLAIHVHFHLA